MERLQVIMTLSEDLQQHKAPDHVEDTGAQQTATGDAGATGTVDGTNATGSAAAADAAASAVEAALGMADASEFHAQPMLRQQQEQYELWGSAAGTSTNHSQPNAVLAVPAIAAAATSLQLSTGNPSHPWDVSAVDIPGEVSPGLVVNRVAIMQAELDALEAIAATLAVKALPRP